MNDMGTCDGSWVKLERIQFVAACNPSTDIGRVALSGRFLRHVCLVLVDYPADESLKKIYEVLNRDVLCISNYRGGRSEVRNKLLSYVQPLTDAMVDFWNKNKKKFTQDIAPQYIYSPRELSRWVRFLSLYFDLMNLNLPSNILNTGACNACSHYVSR